jgi:hypothetical protein
MCNDRITNPLSNSYEACCSATDRPGIQNANCSRQCLDAGLGLAQILGRGIVRSVLSRMSVAFECDLLRRATESREKFSAPSFVARWRGIRAGRVEGRRVFLPAE